MELLVCVINQEDKVDRILSGFLDLGVTGATVLDSQGMGRRLSQDAPVFAGLQTLISRSRPENKTVLSVIESEEKLNAVMRMLEEILGDMNSPGTGIFFTVPVTRVVGLAPKLGPEPA